MPRTKYDWSGVLRRAQAHPGEWVLAFKNVPVALRTRIRWRQGRELEHLTPGALSSVAVKLYKPDGQTKNYGDIWVRWNGNVPIEPPIVLPPDLAAQAPAPGRNRTGEARLAGAPIAGKATQVKATLGDAVRHMAIRAGVPMTTIVNQVVSDIADRGSDYTPPPRPKRERRVTLNSTVSDDVWLAAQKRARQAGYPLWRLIKYELARRVGVNREDI